MPMPKRPKPNPEQLRVLTLRLRELLDRIESDVADAQDVLGEVECAAGLVDEGGKRLDE